MYGCFACTSVLLPLFCSLSFWRPWGGFPTLMEACGRGRTSCRMIRPGPSVLGFEVRVLLLVGGRRKIFEAVSLSCLFGGHRSKVLASSVQNMCGVMVLRCAIYQQIVALGSLICSGGSQPPPQLLFSTSTRCADAVLCMFFGNKCPEKNSKIRKEKKSCTCGVNPENTSPKRAMTKKPM